MPTSLPPSDDTPRPGLGHDMHAQAERRHLAGVTAARLLETRMPVTSTVSGTQPRNGPSVATPKSAVGYAYTPEPDGPAGSVVTQAREPLVIDITARESNPLASFRSEVAVRPHPPSPPSAAVLRAARPMRRDRSALVPVTAFGTLTIAIVSVLAMLFWPGPDDAPAVTQSAVARAETQPVDADAVASDASPSAVATGSPLASSVAATQVPATSTTVRRPATVPARRTVRPPVTRAANQSSTPVTPVSRPSVAQLRVTSSPSGARVTINGIGWGQTPVTVSNLPLGAKTVRVTIEGYRSQQRTVDLRSAGDSAAVHLALKVDGGTVNR